jgi:hypothetical protein
MGYAQFLAWVATTGWRVLGKQKYLNKVWKEATNRGWIILQTHFPKLLNKAKDYYKGFKTADLKIAPKTKIAPKKLTPKTKIEDLQIGPHIDSRGRLWPKFVKPIPKGPAKIIPFPKKPPHLKADGGRIDKALPKRSRDI